MIITEHTDKHARTVGRILGASAWTFAYSRRPDNHFRIGNYRAARTGRKQPPPQVRNSKCAATETNQKPSITHRYDNCTYDCKYLIVKLEYSSPLRIILAGSHIRVNAVDNDQTFAEKTVRTFNDMKVSHFLYIVMCCAKCKFLVCVLFRWTSIFNISMNYSVYPQNRNFINVFDF